MEDVLGVEVDPLVQGLTGVMAATGQAENPPTPVGAGFSDQIGAMNMVHAILAALLWRERSDSGQEVKINLLAGMLAHQNQEMVMAMNFEEDSERPNSGIGHPGIFRAAPLVGQHTREVLREIGMDDDAIGALVESGAAGEA